MKSVTITRDLRPYGANDRVVLPDDIADGLVARGEARDPAPWPEGSEPAKATITQRITSGTLKLAGRITTKKGLPT